MGKPRGLLPLWLDRPAMGQNTGHLLCDLHRQLQGTSNTHIATVKLSESIICYSFKESKPGKDLVSVSVLVPPVQETHLITQRCHPRLRVSLSSPKF